MKYIRTKDGRILESEINDNRKSLGYEPIPFIKQADTLEDLIDGLIVEEKGNPNNWFIMEVYDFKNEEEHLKNWSYHAFIKTDNGLFYVAEMNGEGKLELL